MKLIHRALSLLLALCLLLSVLPVRAAAQNDLRVGLQATARFSSNRLSWTAVENADNISVERSADNVSFTAIASGLGGSTAEYIDETAGDGTHYYYRLVVNGANYSESAQAALRTGLDALMDTATLAKVYADGEGSFDGTRAEILAQGNDAAALSAMGAGTIIFRANPTELSDSSGIVSAVLGTNDAQYYSGFRDKRFRIQVGSGMQAFCLENFATTGEYQTTLYSFNGANREWVVSAKGASSQTKPLENDGGFLNSMSGVTTYYAGGCGSANLFTGSISYILITPEILSTAEANALTGANLPPKAVDITLSRGESATFSVPAGSALSETGDTSVASSAVTSEELTLTVTGAMALTGSSSTYSEGEMPLSDALLRFSAHPGGTGYALESLKNPGVFVSLANTAVGVVSSAASAPEAFTFSDNGSGGFTVYSTGGKYLYFHNNSSSSSFGRFDRVSALLTDTSSVTFQLYRPASDSESASAELPGYVAVGSAADIQTGGLYLIAIQADGSYYVLNPTGSTANLYHHVAKVDPTRSDSADYPYRTVTTLTVTGVGAGRTRIVVGDTVYYITVAEPVPYRLVLDYGLPVTFDPTGGEAGSAATGISSEASGEFGASLSLAQGTAVLNENGTVTFTPTAMLSEAVTFYYRADTQVGEITLLPATSVYYEDSFGNDVFAFNGDWQTAGTTDTDAEQAADFVGASNANVYGYDAAYANYATFSLGSARHATVTQGNSASVSFSFYGTGFDAVGLLSSATGTVRVTVEQGGTRVANYIVDTYYGYTYSETAVPVLDSEGNPVYVYKYVGEGNGNYIIDDPTDPTEGSVAVEQGKTVYYFVEVEEGQGDWAREEKTTNWVVGSADGALYQIPVMKWKAERAGTYTVTITAIYSSIYDHQKDDSYDFYFDAVRIYDPCGDAAALEAYAKDGEANASYMNLRDELLKNGDNGSFFIDGNGAATLEQYDAYGPAAEVYLASGKAVAFNTLFPAQPVAVRLGLKTITGAGSTVTVSMGETTIATIELNSATELYYDLTDSITTTAVEGGYSFGEALTITNTGDAVVSLTNLKWTSAAAVRGTAKAFLTRDELSVALDTVDTILGNSAPAPDPEPTVPEPTVPEPTEPEVKPEDFADLDKAAWYYEGVVYAVENGLMNGMSETEFAPNGTLTRAMLVTVLYRQAGKPAVSLDKLTFTDVDKNAWYAEAVTWALTEGITNGVTAATFAPNDPVTREQMVTFLWRCAEKPASTQALTAFPDAGEVSDYALAAMRWAVEEGILRGDGTGLDPRGEATRAQVANIFLRFEKSLEKLEKCANIEYEESDGERNEERISET